MFRYYIKRILLFVPSLILIGLFTFLLFHAAPNDPVEDLLVTEGYEEDNVPSTVYQKQYQRLSSELKLNLPRFYFSIVPSYYPDTLHRIPTKFERQRALLLLSHHNNWSTINAFIIKGKAFLESKKSSHENSIVDRLLYQVPPQELQSIASSISTTENSDVLEELLSLAQRIGDGQKSKFAWPQFLWYGAENQFHYWISNFVSGKLGRSVLDGRPVWSKITKALWWTIFMVLIGLVITLLVSVPLGVWSAYTEQAKWDGVISNFFYFIYAMPLFWLATLMVVFFTTTQYGSWTNIFPSVGIDPFRGGGSTLSNILYNAKQLVLPIFCLVIHSVAYLSRIVRMSIITESKQQYRLTAQLKGLTRASAYWKHLFPNSLLPLITIIVGIIPASFAGSLVLEVIFNIPGIGRLMYDSILGGDWYVMFSIVMLVGIVTIISYLIGDLLYSLVNPKIRFGRAQVS